MRHGHALAGAVAALLATAAAPAAEGGRPTPPRAIMEKAETARDYRRSCAKLERVLPATALDNVPADEAFTRLAARATMPVRVDRRALADAGIEKAGTVTFAGTNVPLSSVLQVAIESWDRRLRYYVTGGTIHVTTAREMAGISLLRTYDIADLVPATAVRKEPVVKPPTEFDPGGAVDSSGLTEPGGSGGFTDNENGDDTMTITGDTARIVRLVMEMVAPRSWGTSAAIMPVGSLLVVDQHPANHRRITDLLALLRTQQSAAGLGTGLRLHARWMLLDRHYVARLRKSAGGRPPVVDPSAADAPAVQHEAVTYCRSGQRVRIAAGEGQSVRVPAGPVVSKNAAIESTALKMVQWGAAATITVRLREGARAAAVDVDSVVTEPLGKPETNKTPSGQPIDALRFSLRTIGASTVMPTGAPVLLGAVSTGPDPGDRMLCLVLTVDRQRGEK